MGRTTLRIVAMVAIVALSIGLYGWYSQWATVRQFGQGVFVAGVVVIGFGLLALLANSRGATEPDYIHMQGLMRRETSGESRRSLFEFASRLSLATSALLVGAILLLTGFVLRSLG